MKIYEIGTGYTPIPAQVAAATESIVEQLTKSFMKFGQPVQIIDISAEKRAENDLPIIEVRVPSVFTRSDVSLGLIHKVKRVVYSIALARKLKKILKDENDKCVLHFHNQYNLFFFLKLTSKKLRSKAIIAYTNHNGVWSLPWEQSEGTLKKKYFQEVSAMKEADLIFALNSKMKQNIVEHLGISEKYVVQINNGVNTDIYKPLSKEKIAEIQGKYNLSGKTVILQVGSVYENKGQGRTLELLAPMMKENSDLVFAFAGGIVSQEYYDEVMAKAKALGIESQVSYLGAARPGEEMNKIYNIAYATIFASRYEGFVLVCIESMSAGVPVILCSDPFINFGAGCKLTSKSDFQSDLKDLLSNASSYEHLKDSARNNAVNTYSWDRIALDYLNLFAKADV